MSVAREGNELSTREPFQDLVRSFIGDEQVSIGGDRQSLWSIEWCTCDGRRLRRSRRDAMVALMPRSVLCQSSSAAYVGHHGSGGGNCHYDDN
jgi:hypothetical protein